MFAACLAPPAAAVDIEGVQDAALDQPRVNVALRRPGDQNPLTATVSDGMGGTTSTFNIQAFYDTGASGVLISQETADALGLNTQPNVTYQDVGVGGVDEFNVSEPIVVQAASFPGDPNQIDNPATFDSVYDQSFGPLRTQVQPDPAPAATGPLDVIGMPGFAGKTVVIDARGLTGTGGGGGGGGGAQLTLLNTSVYDSGSVPATVPAPDYHVRTSYGDFSRFSRTIPASAEGPALAKNPFIGPNPTVAGGGASGGPPGMTASFGGNDANGSWLLDTGAAASVISRGEAAKLGVSYKEGTYNTDQPVLTGVDRDQQFVLTIGGVGGNTTAAGFYLDRLVVPTKEGENIVFKHAPVLVNDITVKDPDTGETFTLDGVFGDNYLFGSAFVDMQTSPLPTKATGGAFDYVTFDQPSGELGLKMSKAFVPEPTTLAFVLVGGSAVLLRRRRRA